ncbi:MAG: FeoB-associated Cys-rich membrane protein [Bacteroidales bacterium]|nr:FeoB-associated Cys-rich membrane protein [Bacteroidales bacterium]
MNTPTLVILIIIFALAIFAVIFMRKNKAKGGCTNSGSSSCSGCSNADCPLKSHRSNGI